METVFVMSGLLACYWTHEEYDLLKETDEIGKECDLLRNDSGKNGEKILEKEKYLKRKWVYFLRAKYALNRWAAVMMGISLALIGVKPLLIAAVVFPYIMIMIFAPKIVFRLLNRRPS